MESHEITTDVVNAVIINNDSQDCIKLQSSSFCAVSTQDHRWVCGKYDEVPKIRKTYNIAKTGLGEYPIYRVAGNSFPDNTSITDGQLKILGWYLTDGTRHNGAYGIFLYQSTKRKKNKQVYENMISTLVAEKISYTDREDANHYHTIYISKCDFTSWMHYNFVQRVLTFEFISTLL